MNRVRHLIGIGVVSMLALTSAAGAGERPRNQSDAPASAPTEVKRVSRREPAPRTPADVKKAVRRPAVEDATNDRSDLRLTQG